MRRCRNCTCHEDFLSKLLCRIEKFWRWAQRKAAKVKGWL